MRALTAVATMLALLVVACGGDEGGQGGGGVTEPAALLAAAIKQADSGESFESTFELKSDLGGQKIEGSGRLISNADSTKARGPVSFEQGGEKIDFEMILLDDEMYMRSESLEGALPRGKTWMRVRDETFSQQSLTPSQFVDMLRDTPQIEQVGREDVRGKPTIHLRGPIDIAEMVERVGDGPVATIAKQQPEMIERMNAEVDVWIGEQDERLERVALRMTLDGAQGAMTISGDVLEYDVNLDSVKAPPAAEVVDEKDVQGASA